MTTKVCILQEKTDLENKMKNVNKIASFTVDHDLLSEGIYVSRIDGDITTYDLRTRVPNSDDYMDNLTMHSVEHMIATYVRSSRIGDRVIYFGPMGCQTGFYLLVRNADNKKVLDVVIKTLENIIAHDGAMFGESEIECGNYRSLSVEAARLEAKAYLLSLRSSDNTFEYPTK